MSGFNHRKMLNVDFIFRVYFDQYSTNNQIYDEKEIEKKNGLELGSEIKEKSTYGNNIP